MLGADVQKYFLLKVRRKGLITDGFFAFCWTSELFGREIIFVCMARSLSWVVEPNRARIVWGHSDCVIWSVVFTTQMLQKEARMSRYLGWEEYKNSTAFLDSFFLFLPNWKFLNLLKTTVPDEKDQDNTSVAFETKQNKILL